MTDLFAGFETRTVATPDGGIFARIGGAGPPLLLLHGYPETHAMWHQVASALARHFTVVAADLRGYGRSFIAPSVGGHRTYAKRTMAADMLAVMRALGHPQFAVMGHDRGARVTYRLLLDHPGVVTRAVLLDIMTTADFWATLDRRNALRMYHWMFLAQPAPLPEHLIGGDPLVYLEGRFRRGAPTMPGWLNPHVLADYAAAFRQSERRHATCEDYRAGATCDVDDDLADRAAGRSIAVPTRLLWGTRGNLAETADPLALWRPWCPDITGAAIDCGHFIPEEAPAALLADVLPWLLAA
jgi:haloacetate dehalogenase